MARRDLSVRVRRSKKFEICHLDHVSVEDICAKKQDVSAGRSRTSGNARSIWKFAARVAATVLSTITER